jgi:hypothetical protein
LLALSVWLAPPQAAGRGNVSRAESGLGRLEFYSATLDMALRHPFLGVGPGGFSREYPARQTSVAYFSRFPHCLPLEIASEWGLPALLALLALLACAAREARGPEAPEWVRSAGWLLLVFVLHSLTDVQTQFPFLLVLAALALGVLAADPSTESFPESRATAATRLLLSLACLALLAANLSRASGAFDRELAIALARRDSSPAGRAVVSGLLQSGFMADPLDSEAARLWALALLEPNGGRSVAAEMASWALRLDPYRGACLLVSFRADPPDPEQAVRVYQAAASHDRLNYPTFYRLWAEALREQGQSGTALQLLRDKAAFYQPSLLVQLPAFRASDLSDQLVELFVLKSALESEARPGYASASSPGPDLRLALYHCQRLPGRMARMARYAQSLGGALPAHVQVLLRQVEAQQPPAAVEAPLDQP